MSSRLNMVERVIADLREDIIIIRTGSFPSVKELVEDINAYLAERDAHPITNGKQRVRKSSTRSASPARLSTR